MRELKFRAWDKENKHMIQDSRISMSSIMRDYVGHKNDQNGVSLSKNYEVMICSGQQDKHGTEIYEGDIVKSDHNGEMCEIKFGPYSFLDYEASVRYTIGFFWYKCFSDGYMYGDTFGLDNEGNADKFEVIGNIYETPELLGERREGV